MKKLQWIEEEIGLEAEYGGGDYTVTVWEDLDAIDGGYEMVFCRSNTDIPHNREKVTPDALEATMREYCADLRKWRKVIYGERY